MTDASDRASTRAAGRRARWRGGRTPRADAAAHELAFWRDVPGGVRFDAVFALATEWYEPSPTAPAAGLRRSLSAFGAADVRYLIIGGYAVGYHASPRTTKDLDLLLDPAPTNIQRACRALLEFGAHVDIVAHLEAAIEDEVVWMGHPPVRVDLLKDAPGVDFAAAWERRVVSLWNEIEVNVISRDDLIRAKRASGRDQDVVDALNLERSRPTGA